MIDTFVTAGCRRSLLFSPVCCKNLRQEMATSSRLFVFYAVPISVYVKIVRNFSSGCGRDGGLTSGENAYDVLGLKETCTFAEIKASFRRLAKETHPDMAAAHTDLQEASRRFVRIVAAYEILSDCQRRAHYDEYLCSQRKIVQKQPGLRSDMYIYESCEVAARQLEVVEWLKWYRFAINDIVSKKKAAFGSSYMDVLESEFYSAINAAYYGPHIDSMDFLPDCFEAEERSSFETPDVLHLVSGRDLFGFVRLADKDLEISEFISRKLSTFPLKHESLIMETATSGVHFASSNIAKKCNEGYATDVYKDLLLHISGKVVAYATRIPPKSSHNGIGNEEDQDHIHVFLNMDDDSLSVRGSFSKKAEGSRVLLGTISGLRTSAEEDVCDVYDNCGVKTHVVMKHRTLMVKHLHWYQSGDQNSPCECRCSRARLPASKFWLFEPRCYLHDIGGWYIETLGRDKKGKTIPSQRYWDGLEASKQLDRRLHPAMYLLALAYRTLDTEDSNRRKQTIIDVLRPKWLNILRWCKKIV